MVGQPSFCGVPGDEACKFMAAQRVSLDRLSDLKVAWPISTNIASGSHMAPPVKGSTWNPVPSGTFGQGSGHIEGHQALYTMASRPSGAAAALPACRARRLNSASTAATSDRPGASLPSVRNSCLRCCSVSDETLPSRCSCWRAVIVWR